MVMVVLTAVDTAREMNASANNTAIKVNVVDLDNLPVHNAKIKVGELVFYTDNNGNSPLIQLENLQNAYNVNIDSWHTTTVVITKQGFVPTVVVNCIVFDKQSRKLTVKIYPQDQSELPYVCYVESPPDEYVQELISQESKK